MFRLPNCVKIIYILENSTPKLRIFPRRINLAFHDYFFLFSQMKNSTVKHKRTKRDLLFKYLFLIIIFQLED